ncbi:N-acetylmuramoyl-L-alanine amidase [Desulfovibrio aerotolerans]|uniref:N-acetylmuramoyl-L-alanine amidase n=1 Tax=Solidesulfovibrio aerotolerans TaxID=295255 RepID=A0A7C9IMR8_9BACT|nr:N-acetylmuramoyl-L-alanine amidase [Solidesulfovibrio aerotolerans]MYL82639.1 N-acetylmuramoyl-L-alanine amidase [Solidesulfovibrio aerotolerans]
MNRRQLLLFLGAAGLAAGWPQWLPAAVSSDELAGEGQAELTGGNLAKALALLLEAEAKDPRNDRVQALLGRAYFQQGDARTALVHFSLAVRLNPEDTLSRLMAETISQFPLPAGGGAGREPASGRTRPSQLAREAQAEREALLGAAARSKRPGPLRLLIDPGHGGTDAGGVAAGLREADVTLDLALRLARLLAAARDEAAIQLTRTADVSLPGWARAGLAGFYGADLFISLHAARVADPKASGVMITSFAREQSDALAALVCQTENAASGATASWASRGGEGVFVATVREAAGQGGRVQSREWASRLARAIPAAGPLPVRGAATGPLRLLDEVEVPAVLIEAGFLSHPGDAAVLADADKRQALAQGLADALLTVARTL